MCTERYFLNLKKYPFLVAQKSEVPREYSTYKDFLVIEVFADFV